ncbi:hypothetical protein B842_00850 [Corynebacterium humireducens NBRC 106098 = DSM 45392]|uniref:Suppressor of fused-like domain-containing protein n=1 Tax=Corynebacterium humireducens NBRC 106098 = DSM 45392 TaxID=1223515 RepID=A0A0B5D077_9CORY|nr:suppressor of fused domain protein [Corynebacterium humireducens]AJE32026.1 hypothetical protein B842_00850 [Corynebacterium humireducens NBRC 106098 = DSM 45392]
MKRDDTIYWIDQLLPAELQTSDRVVTADLGDGQRVAVTVGFADVDTGLVTVEDGTDVRSELIIVGRATEQQLTSVLHAAWAAFEGGDLPAQPGTLLPQLDADLEGVSVAHGICVPPYLWGGEVPRVTEDERLTVLLQLVMLTDAEYAYAAEEGAAALQQALGEAGIDLLDWQR